MKILLNDQREVFFAAPYVIGSLAKTVFLDYLSTMDRKVEPLEWSVKSLENIPALELYAILKLRADVFIIEHDCIYPDMDDKDQHALHVVGSKNGEIIAYTRIFDRGGYFDKASLGRVVVKESERKFKYGHELIRQSVRAIEEHFGKQPIKISAQQYLIKFYESHRFKAIGEGYLEDGIPHISMLRS